MIREVIKRDGKVAPYDNSKIEKAIFKAAYEVDKEKAASIASEVSRIVENSLTERYVKPRVEEIQDIVELSLMKLGYHLIAKRYILYREERKKKREEKWLKNELAESIWENKYRHNGESFDDFLERISNGNSEVKKAIREKLFCPGGRILAYRGLHKEGKKATYSNCYVNPSVEDNLESIFQVAYEIARTFSYGGGSGVDISLLRPNGAKVNNAANTTSGACSFMKLYDVISKVIGQKGRRAALMISMDVHHPDIESFVDIKNNLELVTKANISVRVTDDFMKAVEEDRDFKLKFYVKDTGEMIVKTIKARTLFNKIAYSNWRMAEPGFLLWDRITSWNIPSEDDEFKLASSNPCVTGDTMIMKDKGMKRASDFKENDLIKTVTGIGKVEECKLYKNKEVYLVEFSDGGEIKCTADHQFQAIKKGSDTCRYSFIKLKDLEVGDWVRLNRGIPDDNSVKDLGLNPMGLTDREYGFLVGILLGDGCITKNGKHRKHLKIASNIEEEVKGYWRELKRRAKEEKNE